MTTSLRYSLEKAFPFSSLDEIYSPRMSLWLECLPSRARQRRRSTMGNTVSLMVLMCWRRSLSDWRKGRYCQNGVKSLLKTASLAASNARRKGESSRRVFCGKSNPSSQKVSKVKHEKTFCTSTALPHFSDKTSSSVRTCFSCTCVNSLNSFFLNK